MEQKLVDREKLRMELRKLFTEYHRAIEKWLAYAVEYVIDDALIVEAEPVKHGRWINGKCSECGCDRVITKVYRDDEVTWIATYRDNYCPNCGAKMDLEEVNK